MLYREHGESQWTAECTHTERGAHTHTETEISFVVIEMLSNKAKIAASCKALFMLALYLFPSLLLSLSSCTAELLKMPAARAYYA